MAGDVDFPSDLRSLEGDYELIRELGQGGMAAVYLARHRATGRLVAIKAVRARYLDDADALRRFAREARTVASLDHPNIVRTEAIEQIDDRAVAIIMEHVPGGTVRDRLREFGSLGAEESESILRDIASALVYAHRCGIVHRDVKPENVFLDANRRRALLSDFGIARKIDSDAGITLLGAALGTPQYMSPEQIDGEKVDGRSDVYSLGVLGWELLTGRRPWAGESLYGVIYKQKHEDLPRITSVRPRVPANLLFAIEGALVKDRDRRWQSMDEFLDRLTYSPPPLLSQSYPPGAERSDNEPTVVFRPGELESAMPDVGEPAVAAGDAGVQAVADDEPTAVATPVFTGPVSSIDDFAMPVTLARRERVDDVEPSFTDTGYALPEFLPNADSVYAGPPRRGRVLKAVGLVVPFGIAAVAAFVVLGGGPRPSAQAASRAQRLTTSAGRVGLDSLPSGPVVPAPAVPAPEESAVPDDDESTDSLRSSGGALTSPAVVGRSNRWVRKTPVSASTRDGGATSTRSAAVKSPVTPVPAGAPSSTRADTSRRAASARTAGDASDPAVVGSRGDSSVASHEVTVSMDDPFRIPESSSASPTALGARVPSPRCRLAATADQRACLSAYVVAGDAGLNRAFDSLVSEMRRVARTAPGAPDPPTVQRIRVEQRAWLSIRETECPRTADPGAGPFWAQSRAACFTEMANTRAAELREAVKRLRRR